ncbi:MAG TPA: hypothetical protein V6D17_10985 [Candidatus Obscuribacterales bacterium]
MRYLLKVSDASNRHMVVLSLDEDTIRRPAIDVVFDVLGRGDADSLVAREVLAEGQLDDFMALQRAIFGRDAQGMFIREPITFLSNGVELNPDLPMINAFVAAHKEGIEYRRCDVVVGGAAFAPCTGAGLAGSNSSAPATGIAGSAIDGKSISASGKTESALISADSQHGSMREFARLFLLHQINVGAHVDVTKDLPELNESISWAEREGLIEIDVKSAAYKLTEKGKRTHASYIEEAQNLIRRYDIFGDVDIDASGKAHFDTGLGRDLRVPVYEMEGIDPFRARFILGLNDGEWDRLDNWTDVIEDKKWYDEIFRPIETAPSIEDIGEDTLKQIIHQGKALLREGSQSC